MLRQRKLLQAGNLLVQRCQILLDYIGQLRYLDGPVIEQRLAFRN